LSNSSREDGREWEVWKDGREVERGGREMEGELGGGIGRYVMSGMGVSPHHFSTPLAQEEQSLVQCMNSMLQEDPDLPLSKYRDYLKALFEDSSVKEFTEKKMFKYIHYNAHHLPMYAKPDMI
jgi:hypothetical protein